MSSSTASNSTLLHERWVALQASQGRKYLRDEAADLGSSELELLTAIRTGDITRLDPSDIPSLMADIAALGEVRTMSRNESAVIEATGRYDGLAFGAHAGQTVGDLELRIFPSRWVHVLALEVTHGDMVRGSVQVFDATGTSVHKLFVSDLAAWREVVDRHRAIDQDPPAIRTSTLAVDRPDDEVDSTELHARWDGLGHTHEFHGMLRDLGVGRLQALRLAGKERARRVAPDVLGALLDEAHRAAEPIMLFVGNQGVVHIHIGIPGKVVHARGWLNILEPRFNLHVRASDIASAWIVTKPTADGPVTSLECYDASGSTIIQVFGKRDDARPVPPTWSALLDRVAGA